MLKVRALSRVLGYYHSRSVLAAILRLGIIGRLEVLVRSREFDTAHFPRECAYVPEADISARCVSRLRTVNTGVPLKFSNMAMR